MMTVGHKAIIMFQVGLMRDGRLLAEESPSKLLRMFQTEILEEVFLILSQRQNDGRSDDAIAVHGPLVQSSNTDISMASFDTTRSSTDVTIQCFFFL
jgi:hypothetical protein